MIVLGWGGMRAQEERPIIYPFDVTMGGQKAVVQKGNALFAVIEQPIEPDAVVALEKVSPLFVINAFLCQEDGTVLDTGAPAAIVFKQNVKEVKLSETMDKKPLRPGTYLMNLVAHGSTSRVVFTVSDGKRKVKVPQLKKIADYLKNKLNK